MPKYWDICTRQKYEKNGQEKIRWLKCGVLKCIDNKYYIELSMFPSTSFFAFEQRKKEEAKPADTEEFSG